MMLSIPLLCVSFFTLPTDLDPVNTMCLRPYYWSDVIYEIDECTNYGDFACDVKYEEGRVVFEYLLSSPRNP